MGKWATYRKRGRAPVSPTLIPAPPAPVVALVGTEGTITAQGADDIGGRVSVEGALDPGGSWLELDNQPWQRVQPFSTDDYDPYTYYRARETGNGVVYLGQSPPSNTVTP